MFFVLSIQFCSTPTWHLLILCIVAFRSIKTDHVQVFGAGVRLRLKVEIKSHRSSILSHLISHLPDKPYGTNIGNDFKLPVYEPDVRGLV